MRAVALTGLLVVIMFAVFSLTDSAFEQRSTIMFYALMVIIPLTVRSTSLES
jgi:hypothetical protein